MATELQITALALVEVVLNSSRRHRPLLAGPQHRRRQHHLADSAQLGQILVAPIREITDLRLQHLWRHLAQPQRVGVQDLPNLEVSENCHSVQYSFKENWFIVKKSS